MLPKGASRLQKGALRVTKRSIIGYKKEHRLQKGAGVLLLVTFRLQKGSTNVTKRITDMTIYLSIYLSIYR
jgi:hypothetical protein